MGSAPLEGGGVANWGHPWNTSRLGRAERGRHRGGSCVQQSFEFGDVLGWSCDAFECSRTIGNSLHETVSGGDRWVSDRLVVERNSVAEQVAVGRLDMAFVCAVMFQYSTQKVLRVLCHAI